MRRSQALEEQSAADLQKMERDAPAPDVDSSLAELGAVPPSSFAETGSEVRARRDAEDRVDAPGASRRNGWARTCWLEARTYLFPGVLSSPRCHCGSKKSQ